MRQEEKLDGEMVSSFDIPDNHKPLQAPEVFCLFCFVLLGSDVHSGY